MAADLNETTDWDQRTLRFECRRWPYLILVAFFLAIACGFCWNMLDIAINDTPYRGKRYPWLAGESSFVRAAFYAPFLIASASLAWWHARTRLFRPQFVELTRDALTVSYLNRGKPIAWKCISKIIPRSAAIQIVASGLRLSRFDFGEARIATNMIKGSRHDLETALMRYWSRNA